MHIQLVEIEEQLAAATARVKALAKGVSDEQWQRRPRPGSWSAAECIEHLNLTSVAYLPILEEALGRARDARGRPPAYLRRDPIGWLIWRSVRPSARMKAKTSPAFTPGPIAGKDAQIAAFTDLQTRLAELLRQAEGRPIQKVKVASPFSDRVRYSLFSAFSILAVHELRHVLQAERALAAIRA